MVIGHQPAGTCVPSFMFAELSQMVSILLVGHLDFRNTCLMLIGWPPELYKTKASALDVVLLKARSHAVVYWSPRNQCFVAITRLN